MSDQSPGAGSTPRDDQADDRSGQEQDGPKRRGKAKARHTIGTVVLASAIVLGLVTGLSVVFIYRYLNGNITVSDAFNQVDNRPDKWSEGSQEPLNILVLGSDTREGDNRIDSEAGGGVSDVTILLHLSADRSRAYGVSIPRDSLVTRPDCGDDNEIPGGENQMWNVAYALGGEGCTVEQFEQVTGVRVDDFVVMDFTGFKDMVNAIDGVPICVPRDIDDPEHNIFIKAGEREAMGEEALDYVRVRATIGDGSDIGRIKRQQAFIAAMVNKLVSAGTLTRPDRVVSFLNAATKSLTTSPGLDNLTRLGKLGYDVGSIGLDQVQFLTVPWQYDQRPEFRGRVSWQEDEAALLWKRIRLDRPLPPRMQSDAISAERPPGKRNGGNGNGGGGGGGGPTQEEVDEAEFLGLCA